MQINNKKFRYKLSKIASKEDESSVFVFVGDFVVGTASFIKNQYGVRLQVQGDRMYDAITTSQIKSFTKHENTYTIETENSYYNLEEVLHEKKKKSKSIK